MENEKERLEEDLDRILNDIDSYNEVARRWEYFNEPDPDFSSLEELEAYINTLSNEAMYLEHCLEDYDV